MASNRLPEKTMQRLTMHVDDCATCGRKLAELRVTCTIFAHLAEAGPAEVVRLSQQGDEARTRSSWLQGKFALAGGSLLAALCVVCLLIFVVPQTRVQAKANALLEESIQAQPREVTAPHYRMKAGATACPHEKDLTRAVLSDSLCSAVSRHLQQTVWATGSPLSAKTFQSWRAMQAHPKDRVNALSSGWKIETTSDEGAVQRATLELRSKDHGVAQLVLQFRGVAEEASFFEEDEPASTAVSEVAPVRGDKMTTTLGDDPADVLEVRAWSVLHDVKSDSVWDASVVRSGQSVRVNVAADDDGRRQRILHLLASPERDRISQASAGMLRDMPKRTFSGVGPALAERWVKAHYPESAEQTTFQSEAAHLSRDVLGRALWIERMEERRSALQACSCADAFMALISAERRELTETEMRLAQTMQPLAGPGAAARPLSAADARKLDLSVQELLISSSQSPQEDAMQQQLVNVQKLLHISAK